MSVQELEKEMGSNMASRNAKGAPAIPVSKPKMTRIILEENDNISPSGQFFQLNGDAYMLRPGIEVDVPEGIIEILDHAVESRPVIDPQSRQVTGYRDRLRFPYRTVRAKSVDIEDEE